MKSDSRVLRIGGPAPEAFEALFQVLEEPFALCDVTPRLLAANLPFVDFCASHSTTPEALVAGLVEVLAQTPSLALEPGGSADVEVPLPGQRFALLAMARKGDTL
ncbi:MAG TPA: histidine kinase, partial [Myxococcaceae bacterium]